jgi:serine/threonine-protein kinase
MREESEEVLERAKARIGSVLRGKYRLDRVLGVGGMATVYAATHRNGKEFAVKVLHPELALRRDVRQRFVREGYVANSVKHPGAVAVLDDDVEEDGTVFLVMELLHGQTVENLWQRCNGRLPVLLATGVGLQVLDVLGAAHACGVVHRDIKPENLMITREGQLKVLDFGIARVRDMAAGSATQTGFTMGTPAFMAPEHAMAKVEQVDARTDLWALAATMFTIMTGRSVHRADHPQQALILAGTEHAPPVGSIFPEIPEGICKVVDRALKFDQADRWPDAKEMRDALREASEAAFGEVPSRSRLVELIQAQGAGSIRPPAGDSLNPGPHSSPPTLAGPTTAEPVTTDPAIVPPQSLPAPSLRRRALLLGAPAAVVLLIIGIIIARSGAPAAPAASASAASPPNDAPAAAPESPPVPAEAPPAAVTAALTSTPPSPPAVRTASAPEVSRPAASPPRTKPATAPARNAAPKGCNPPYELDANGNKKWKRECL